MALLCGHAGRLVAQNGGFRPGQWRQIAQTVRGEQVGGPPPSPGIDDGVSDLVAAATEAMRQAFARPLSVEVEFGRVVAL